MNGPKSVRFVIKKPKTDFLLAELDKTLNCIETKTLPLSLVTTEPLGDALIEELGRITNTHIAKSSNGRRVSALECFHGPHLAAVYMIAATGSRRSKRLRECSRHLIADLKFCPDPHYLDRSP